MNAKGWQWYGLADLQLCPFMPGSPVYIDETLPFLYRSTKQEGKMMMTFCGDDFNLGEFVNFFIKNGVMQVLCEVEENKRLKPVGYSWISNPHGIDGARSAAVGFCFFNNASKRSSARDLARLAIAYGMMDLRINVGHGIQIASNTAAQNFARRVGFKFVGTVPKYHHYRGELVDASIMCVEDTEWLPSFERWFEEQKVIRPK